MNSDARPRINPEIVLRQESDDWALLFDPDTGAVFGLHPVSVLIWKLLDGRHTVDEILDRVRGRFIDVPDDSANHIREFIEDLVARGLAFR